MNPAEAIAKATGSVAATHRVERRHLDGTLTVEEEHTYGDDDRVVLPPITDRTATVTFTGTEIEELVAAVAFFMYRTGGDRRLYDKLIEADLEALARFIEQHDLPAEEGAF